MIREYKVSKRKLAAGFSFGLFLRVPKLLLFRPRSLLSNRLFFLAVITVFPSSNYHRS